ncbi:MAG TPA: hypothetical protein VJO53_14545 [Candidatus Acidoferrales bacterium]|nr:hypothetical protein [Candidatus Acidoferrales bacterium]
MLTVPQIEALRKTNPQLYETLKRLAGASLGPNQGWSMDHQITDGHNFARVVSGALTAGKIDPTKSGVLMKGSVPPTWSGAFTYVSTTSSLTWSWSALTIYRADGATTAVPNGSVIVTGLTAATTYYFYPYWDDTAAALAWVAGGAGSPANAQTAKTNLAAQQQALQGRIPLSQGAIVAATTSSGTGGGSGGGSGSCLRAGTVVLTKERGTVVIETCKVGEHLRCPAASSAPGAGRASGESAEAWTRIQRIEVRDADTFIRLHFSNAESLDVTPHHIFTLADGSPMRAERLCLSDVFIGRFGRLTLTRIEVVAAAQNETAGAAHAVPGHDARRDAAHAATSREITSAEAQIPAAGKCPWQKVTVSCEPTHQFFAGRHAASVLTHNYTFSS